MRAVLDGAALPTCAAFHTRVAEELMFPDYYGRNLDALYDCLTDLPGGTEIHFEHFAAFRGSVGEQYADRVLHVLRLAAEESGLSLTVME